MPKAQILDKSPRTSPLVFARSPIFGAGVDKGYSGNKGEYGFRVFRRGRLIIQYAKIGFNPHPEARQIVGEIHLDHVPVTHNKREFIQRMMGQEVRNKLTDYWKDNEVKEQANMQF